MEKVYQRIDDPLHGDCFKCSVCTLFGLGYDEVPNFIEYGDYWWVMTAKFFADRGYIIGEPYLLNPNVPSLENPTGGCFNENFVEYNGTLKNLKTKHGINGLFMATVYSPKYTNPSEHPIDHLHSVLCDINFNVVFDPQKKYEGIVKYPYADIIGYNGIRGIDTICEAVDMEEHAWRKMYYLIHSFGYFGVESEIVNNATTFLKTVLSYGYELPNIDNVTMTPYGTITIDYKDDKENLLSIEIGKTKIGFFTDYQDGVNEVSDGMEADFQVLPIMIEKHIKRLTEQ